MTIKSLLVGVIIAAFAAVALFGIFNINYEDMDHASKAKANCIASLVTGIDCTKIIHQTTNFIYLHVKAFQEFVSVTWTSLAELLLLALLIIFTLIFIFRLRHPGSRLLIILDKEYHLHRLGFLSWLAFHENSPGIS